MWSNRGEVSLGRRTEFPELEGFFELVRDESPFRIEQYRQRGWARASSGDRTLATAFSALEQAQWDLAGKALGAPVSDLFGGRLRDALGVYANINRATRDRSPEEMHHRDGSEGSEGSGRPKYGSLPTLKTTCVKLQHPLPLVG